jgi:hypothetical protein
VFLEDRQWLDFRGLVPLPTDRLHYPRRSGGTL